MKKMRKFPAALLALAMLMTAALTGCQSKVTPPDEIAMAIFDLEVKEDPSAFRDALGYDSNEAVIQDIYGDEGMTTFADEMVAAFAEDGINVSDADIQKLQNSFSNLIAQLNFSAEVKEMNERAGTAVVTCRVTPPDYDSISDEMAEAMTSVLLDPELGNDPDKYASLMIGVLCDMLDQLEPASEPTSFDVDFVLDIAEVDGKAKKCWLPEDTGAFFDALSEATDIF